MASTGRRWRSRDTSIVLRLIVAGGAVLLSAPSRTWAQSADSEPRQTAATVDAPSPTWASLLALVFPGGGHYYIGRPVTGLVYTGSEAALIGGGVLADVATEQKTIGRRFLVGIGANLHMYQIFDAYRDARLMKGDQEYEHPVDRAEYVDLALAPFDPEALWDWRTLLVAGVFIGSGVALRVAYADQNWDGPHLGEEGRRDNFFGRNVDPNWAYAAATVPFAVKFTHVGLGEEALFRGALQATMREWWGPGWAIGGQAVVFSAFHVVNPLYAFDPAAYAFATLAGVAFGWLFEATDDLRKPTAAHMWIDFSYSMTNYYFSSEESAFGYELALVW